MAAKRKILAELRLKLEGAPTPERVEAAAKMFREAIDAAGDAFVPGEITLVVSNWDMQTRLRGYSKSAARSVNSISTVIDDPLEAVQERPASAKKIARALARSAPALKNFDGAFYRGRSRKPMKKLDDDFVRVMEAAAKQVQAPDRTLSGTTTIISPVLRAGRVHEGSDIKVRVLVEGRPAEVALGEGTDPEAFFDAAKQGGTHRIVLQATWMADARGVYSFDLDELRVLRTEPHTDVSGEALLAAVRVGEGTAATISEYLQSEFDDDDPSERP